MSNYFTLRHRPTGLFYNPKVKNNLSKVGATFFWDRHSSLRDVLGPAIVADRKEFAVFGKGVDKFDIQFEMKLYDQAV